MGLPAGRNSELFQQSVFESEKGKTVDIPFPERHGTASPPGPDRGGSHIDDRATVSFAPDGPNQRKVKVRTVDKDNAGRLPGHPGFGHLLLETPGEGRQHLCYPHKPECG